jgi:DNA-binding transcriptional LysR family regulator
VRGVDINRYRYLAAVARTRNFTKAAEELHLTQPALTKAIRKTEMEIGAVLFDRTANPLRLTYAGECFMNEVRKILNVQDTLDREMNKIATGQRGKVVVGVPIESASTWLPRILPKFMETHPDIEIDIAEGNSDSFERGMLDGTIDFSIYTLPVHSKDLDYEVIGEQPIILVSSCLHPFAKDADLSVNSPLCPQYLEPSRLNGEKFLTLTPDRGMYRTMTQILERHGVNANIILRLSSNYTISALAASGLGVCFSTCSAGERLRFVRDLHPVFYTIDDPVFARKTILAYRKGNCLSSAARDMLDISRRVMARVHKRKIVVRH